MAQNKKMAPYSVRPELTSPVANENQELNEIYQLFMEVKETKEQFLRVMDDGAIHDSMYNDFIEKFKAVKNALNDNFGTLKEKLNESFKTVDELQKLAEEMISMCDQMSEAEKAVEAIPEKVIEKVTATFEQFSKQ